MAISYSSEEMQRVNESFPLISKIKIGAKDFNITTIKDLSESHPAHRGYVYGRTHYYNEDISFSQEEVSKMVSEPSHEYYALCRHDFTESGATWLPRIPWFVENKPYDLVIEKHDKSGDNFVFSAYITPEQPGTDVISDLNFEYASLNLQLTYETKIGFRLTWVGVSSIFRLIIKPRPHISYQLLKQLDAKYLPIDNRTLNYDRTTGELYANTLFTNNLTLSQDFGKYKAGEEIPVVGKSMVEFISEALGDINRPKIERLPSITFYAPELIEAPYEVNPNKGVKLDWKLNFDPGKYSHGTNNRNDSTIYVSKVIFTLTRSGHTQCQEPPELIFVLNHQQKDLDVNGSFEHVLEVPSAEENKLDSYTNTNVILSGYIQVASAEPCTVQLSAKVFFAELEEEYAINQDGTEPTPAVRMEIPLPTIYNISYTTESKWYYGSDARTTDEKKFKNFCFGCFPETYETTGMQRWYFKAPSGQIEKDSFKFTNAKTGAAAGPIDFDNTTSAGYDIYTIANHCADKNTNVYKIDYTKTGGTT